MASPNSGARRGAGAVRSYLENVHAQPLNRQMRKHRTRISTAAALVCGGGQYAERWRGKRVHPVGPFPDASVQASVSAVQQQQQQQMQQQQQQQQQPSQGQTPQSQDEKKDSNGVAGWIKDMFGSN